MWVVFNGGPPKLSLPRASKMVRPGLYAESKFFHILLEYSKCVLLDDFDECKNECSIRVHQLMYTSMLQYYTDIV